MVEFETTDGPKRPQATDVGERLSTQLENRRDGLLFIAPFSNEKGGHNGGPVPFPNDSRARLGRSSQCAC
jgi:hypothetical protein